MTHLKTLRRLFAAGCLFGLITASSLVAQDGEKKKPESPPPERPVREAVLKEFDKNGDGKLDDAERKNMREMLQKRRQEARLKRFDKNGDGKLDDEELKAAREAAKNAGGNGPPAARRAELLKKFDKNGDGKLDDEERKAMRAEVRERAKERRKGGGGEGGGGTPPEGGKRTTKL